MWISVLHEYAASREEDGEEGCCALIRASTLVIEELIKAVVDVQGKTEDK